MLLIEKELLGYLARGGGLRGDPMPIDVALSPKDIKDNPQAQ